MRQWKEELFRLTPLGRADVELRKYFSEDDSFTDSDEYSKYEASRKRYRNRKIFEIVIKILLYASVITSVAMSLGFSQIRILNRIASFFGLTVLLILYGVALYTTALYKEEYHLRREILVNKMGEQSQNIE